MTPFNAIPASTYCWLIGSAGAWVFGIKSVLRYLESKTQLTKYTAWFSLTIALSLALYSLPTLFTLNTHTLYYFDLAGEGLTFVGLVFQAAIMWSLILRFYFNVYWLTIPVAIIGLGSWIYSFPYSKVVFIGNVITGSSPLLTNLVLAGLLIVLFTPVGVYFLLQVPKQAQSKSKASSAVVGLVFIGAGLIGGGFLIVTGKIMTPVSLIPLDIFFFGLFVTAAWPRQIHHSIMLPTPSPPTGAS